MAEIDNWIKEQLKKGYKKEQIKESLRKAGYQQNTIDSVDSLAKKQKNKKTMFFFGLIVVLILIFVIGNYAWTHRSAREADLSVPERYRLLDFPSSIKELNTFVDFCSDYLIYEEETNDASALCILEFNKDLNVYEPSFKNIDKIGMLEQGQYISFNMDLTKIIKNSLERGILELNNDEVFNLCIVSSPLLDDNVHPVTLEEGVVICLPNLTLDEPHIGSITSQIGFIGFIPESDLFSIKVYSVPYEKISEILSKKDFTEKERIVESYTLLNEFEKKVLKTG